MKFVFIFLILFLNKIFKVITKPGKEYGAYISTPDINIFDFRMGTNLDSIKISNSKEKSSSQSWDKSKLSFLSYMTGITTQRIQFSEENLYKNGLNSEIETIKKIRQSGINNIIGYLTTPSLNHSSLIDEENLDKNYPLNLYEDIWDSEGNINKKNYWAYFVYQTISTYKDYIKVWEPWNKPDYTKNPYAPPRWRRITPRAQELLNWNENLFPYIRLLRITYEVTKKISPDSWVSVGGGILHENFLGAILTHTDEKEEGKLDEDFYPNLGGAYFDCVSFSSYPSEHEWEKGGSDKLIMKIIQKKINMEKILEDDGFGKNKEYPQKIFINSETGLNSESIVEKPFGGEIVRRNFIIKLAFYCLEYDIKQTHMGKLIDKERGDIGDFNHNFLNYLNNFTTVNEGLNYLKNSTKGRIILQNVLHIDKFVFDNEKTKNFRNVLPEGAHGIVLKRKKLIKDNNEKYYSNSVYSLWLYCNETEDEKKEPLNFDIILPFKKTLKIDWEGNEKILNNGTNFIITTTPVFLIEYMEDKNNSKKEEKKEGKVERLSTLTMILICVGLFIVGFIFGVFMIPCFKRIKNIDSENNNGSNGENIEDKIIND